MTAQHWESNNHVMLMDTFYVAIFLSFKYFKGYISYNYLDITHKHINCEHSVLYSYIYRTTLCMCSCNVINLMCLSSFCTTALQQSNVKLTWDETDPKRVKAMMRK